MKKITKNIIDAIDDSNDCEGEKVLIEGVKEEGRDYSVQKINGFYTLYWGEDEVVKVCVGSYISLITEIFEVYIRA